MELDKIECYRFLASKYTISLFLTPAHKFNKFVILKIDSRNNCEYTKIYCGKWA